MEEHSLKLNISKTPDTIRFKRTRILKTGLFGVDRYLDMTLPQNVKLFEDLAQPGTELILQRNAMPDEPWRIEVYAKSGEFLGRVTTRKAETAARLIDAGMKVIAITNDSLIHNSDVSVAFLPNEDDEGWSKESRFQEDHDLCNLPFGIYLVEE